jgi:hypothetical protein
VARILLAQANPIDRAFEKVPGGERALAWDELTQDQRGPWLEKAETVLEVIGTTPDAALRISPGPVKMVYAVRDQWMLSDYLHDPIPVDVFRSVK